MSRTAKESKNHRSNRTAISVRLSEESLSKVEQFRDQMARDLPGSEPSVTDAVRVLIERGLRSATPR